jgi:hypothetical protein
MISFITGSIGVGVAIIILLLIRKDRLHVHHGLGWILLAAIIAILGFFPGIIDFVAQRLGVAYPPTLALTLALAMLVIKILLMDLERSRMAMRNQRLTQRIAMLEADLRKAIPPQNPENRAADPRDSGTP